MTEVALAWVCALIAAVGSAHVLLSLGFRNNGGTALIVGGFAFLGLIFGGIVFLA